MNSSVFVRIIIVDNETSRNIVFIYTKENDFIPEDAHFELAFREIMLMILKSSAI